MHVPGESISRNSGSKCKGRQSLHHHYLDFCSCLLSCVRCLTCRPRPQARGEVTEEARFERDLYTRRLERESHDSEDSKQEADLESGGDVVSSQPPAPSVVQTETRVIGSDDPSPDQAEAIRQLQDSIINAVSSWVEREMARVEAERAAATTAGAADSASDPSAQASAVGVIAASTTAENPSDGGAEGELRSASLTPARGEVDATDSA